MLRRLIGLIICISMVLTCNPYYRVHDKSIPYWESDSSAMESIVSFVSSVTDKKSDDFVEPERRIAVFDMDGTLYGELFPTYFDEWLLLHRLLHDNTYEAPAEDKAFALAAETALLKGEPEPDYDKSSAQMAAEAFKGFTVEQYRDYVRDLMAEDAVGFDGMTYGEGFYKPMVALVEYLAEHDFKVFISSGSERSLVRELTEDTLGKWIPPYQMIGSTFSLEAEGQGSAEGRKYTYKPDDQVLMEGNLVSKNQKMNKVITIVDEIGCAPLLVFGNSSGDVSMAQYALQHSGKAYMLLCDDTERDYGSLKTAASFEKTCNDLGFETVSMRDDFKTIYGDGVVKTHIGEQ